MRSSILWVQGSAAIGKTWGLALATQHLKKNSSDPIVFFYSSYKIGSRRSPIFIRRFWIWQLIDQSPRAFEAIRNILPESPTGVADLEMLWRAFSEAIKSVGYCHLLLDALDECYGLEASQNDSKGNNKSIIKSGDNILWFIYKLLRHARDSHMKILITSHRMAEVGVVLRMRGFASANISTYTPSVLNIATYTFNDQVWTQRNAQQQIDVGRAPSGLENMAPDEESSPKEDFGRSRLLQEYISWRQSLGFVDELDSFISHTKQDLCQLVLDQIFRMDKGDRDRATLILCLVLEKSYLSCQDISDALILDAHPLGFKENEYCFENLSSQTDPEHETYRLCGPLLT